MQRHYHFPQQKRRQNSTEIQKQNWNESTHKNKRKLYSDNEVNENQINNHNNNNSNNNNNKKIKTTTMKNENDNNFFIIIIYSFRFVIII